MNPSENIVPNFTDHDLLNRLDTKFTIFTSQYADDMKEVKDGTGRRLDDHEHRIKVVEDEQHDRKTREKAVWAVIVLAASIIGYLLNVGAKLIWPKLY